MTPMQLESALQRVLEAQMYLMASITGPDPIDRRIVCRELHHMSGDLPMQGTWSHTGTKITAICIF
jgi:hypothetical protein